MRIIESMSILPLPRSALDQVTAYIYGGAGMGWGPMCGVHHTYMYSHFRISSPIHTLHTATIHMIKVAICHCQHLHKTMLKLPEYSPAQTMSERLLYAISSNAGFELGWRIHHYQHSQWDNYYTACNADLMRSVYIACSVQRCCCYLYIYII